MKFSTSSKITFLIFILSFSLQAQNSYWSLQKETTTNRAEASKKLDKEKYKTYTLGIEGFKSELQKISSQSSVNSRSTIVMSFPNHKGELERFSVEETFVMAPQVAAKHPEIKTYKGFGIDNSGSKIHFTVSPHGIQTMTRYVDGLTVYTVPSGKGGTTNYISYESNVRLESTKNFQCLTEDVKQSINTDDLLARKASDQTLRTFRIAISTTAEYTNFWDAQNPASTDAQADALAQVVSTLNRVNGVYETDLAINFQLVSGTEIIYTNSATDPYTFSNNFGGQLQSTLDNVIGSANYDIGHLFDFGPGNDGSGGCIGCVCEAGRKGRGFSSHTFTDNDGGPYMSDFFDIDYVSHEIGHQMGANHTWSFASEGTGVNFEPGSGTTIMAYAGITGSDDVQDHTDPYMHYASIEQILTNITSSPNNCWTSTPITNNPPVANAGNDFVIPAGTAFVLRGSATDDNSDLNYAWEQIDNGVTDFSNFGPTKLTGAIFRSRIGGPNRYMPTLSRIIAGELTETEPVETINNTSWETISTISRDLNFALTVREVSSPSNQTGSDTMRVTVDDTAGPFVVTSQTTSETWEKCEVRNITWDVANTDTGNVNTATVNIRLSIDGGLTYPFLLAENVSNDGSHNITVPDVGAIPVSTARVMVEGNNNIFFAINDTNFTVQNSLGLVGDCSTEEFELYPNPSNGSFILDMEANNLDVELTVFDLKGTLIRTLNFTNVGDRLSERIILNNISRGLYILQVINGGNSYSRKILIE